MKITRQSKRRIDRSSVNKMVKKLGYDVNALDVFDSIKRCHLCRLAVMLALLFANASSYPLIENH